MHAAREMALETAVPAQADQETYPRSAVEEAPSGLAGPLEFLPQRRPTVPSPAGPRPGPGPRQEMNQGPAPARREPPDLALLDQVLRGLQRLA
ncbi:MAG TPA: hypothetical protein VGD68_07955 [Streptosporangiaceae bacterium]